MKKRTVAIIVTGLCCALLSACGSTAPESTAPAVSEAEPAVVATEQSAETAPAETEAQPETEAVAAESETTEALVDADFTEEFLAAFAATDNSENAEAPTADDVQIEEVGGYQNYESDEYSLYAFYGANGLDFVVYYTWDTTDGSLLTLDELLGSDQSNYEAINDYIRSQMEEALEDPDGIHYFVEDFNGIDEDTLWYLDDNGSLTIVFGEATIAPHSDGIISFTIPADVFDPAAVL